LFAGPRMAINDNKTYSDLTDEEKINLEKFYKEKYKKLLLKKGLKEFEIEGIKILALNKKNAIKKFKKLNK
jgi:hypothetical protein